MAKQKRGVETMQRVLDAALSCFAGSGLHGATIHDVAAEAGVSIGSIYHHFGSRDRVAFALYCRCMESLLGACSQALSDQADARSGLAAMVRAYLRWVAHHPDAARFIYAAGSTAMAEKWKDELGPFKARLVAPIFTWFGPYIEAGEIVALPPAFYEIVIIGPPAELSRRWLSGAPGLDMDQAMELLPDLIWRALGR